MTSPTIPDFWPVSCSCVVSGNDEKADNMDDCHVWAMVGLVIRLYISLRSAALVLSWSL